MLLRNPFFASVIPMIHRVELYDECIVEMKVMNEEYSMRFGGLGRLYGVDAMTRLANAHVCICGIGGVGSWVVEALARSGVGAITLIDMDDICVTNTNRQLHTLVDTVGLQKGDVMAQRVRLINPDCRVESISDFILADTLDELISSKFDIVVDAIDDLGNKCLLAAHCHKLDIPLVMIGGAGGRRDPTQIHAKELTNTTHDGLLRKVRRRLKYDHGYRGKSWTISCVYSSELPVYPMTDGSVNTTPEFNSTLALDCYSGFGTATFVTGSFGFTASAVVVDLLLNQETKQE